MTRTPEQDIAASETLLDRMPDILFRYASLSDDSGDRLNYARDVILKSKLFFAKSNRFNDPWDCRVSFNFTASESEIREHCQKALPAMYPDSDLSQLSEEIERFVEECLSLRYKEEMDDTMYFSTQRHGVVCLSEGCDSIQMWSYYGDGHRGICYRFRVKTPAITEWVRQFFPVQVRYSSEIPDFCYFTTSAWELVDFVFGTKACGWSHEREWRLVRAYNPGIASFPPEMLEGVILGTRITAVHEQHVRDCIIERKTPVNLYRAVTLKNEFRLLIEDAGPSV